MAGKGSISIQDISKMNAKNMAMANEGATLQSEEWTDAQRKQYLELTNRFSKAMFKISENIQEKKTLVVIHNQFYNLL